MRAFLTIGIALGLSLGCRQQTGGDPGDKGAQRASRPADAGQEERRVCDEPGEHLPMMIAFTRDHCPPCEIMAPWLDALERRHQGRLELLEINIDHRGGRQLADFFGVAIFPSQIYVSRSRREISRHGGVASHESMERQIATLLGGASGSSAAEPTCARNAARPGSQAGR